MTKRLAMSCPFFSNEKCQLISWGSIRIRWDGDWLPFSGIVRKMSTEHMWRRHRAAALDRDGNTDNVLARTVFTIVVNAFTRAERKRKSCIEYVLAELV